jgi:hypothetical protein
MTEFWYVYKTYGGGPRFEHHSFEAALTEAKRLVVETGGRYYILRAEAVVESVAEVQYTYYGSVTAPQSPYSESMCIAVAKEQDPDDSIPF